MRLLWTTALCKWCHKSAMPGQSECFGCRKEREERENE